MSLPVSTSRSRPALRPVLIGSFVWALARMRGYVTSPRFWSLLWLIVVIVAVIGPFETRVNVSFGLGLAFWALLLVPVVLSLFLISIILRESARRLEIAWGWAALAAGIVGTPLVMVVTWLAALVTIGPEHLVPMPMFAVYSPLVTISLVMAVNAVMPVPQPLWGMRPRAQAAAIVRDEVEDLAGPLFSRLPDILGREVLWVRADNHHVELATTRGQARLHVRLADVEAELASLPGFRVHRSWWANLAHATLFEASERDGHALLMIDGTRVPVSRSKRAKVETALARRDCPKD